MWREGKNEKEAGDDNKRVKVHRQSGSRFAIVSVHLRLSSIRYRTLLQNFDSQNVIVNQWNVWMLKRKGKLIGGVPPHGTLVPYFTQIYVGLETKCITTPHVSMVGNSVGTSRSNTVIPEMENYLPEGNCSHSHAWDSENRFEMQILYRHIIQ